VTGVSGLRSSFPFSLAAMFSRISDPESSFGAEYTG
jgi:hypothetical protein